MVMAFTGLLPWNVLGCHRGIFSPQVIKAEGMSPYQTIMMRTHEGDRAYTQARGEDKAWQAGQKLKCWNLRILLTSVTT